MPRELDSVPLDLVSGMSVIVLPWTATKSVVGDPMAQTLRTTCRSMGFRERLCEALTWL